MSARLKGVRVVDTTAGGRMGIQQQRRELASGCIGSQYHQL